ncbi:alpha/beta hydrolase fold domain-containing protein [Arenimonas alkanexedens]
MTFAERMIAAGLRTTLRCLLKPAFHPRWPVTWQRRWLHLMASIGRLPKGITRRDLSVGSVRAERWADERAAPVRDGNILFLHGGGYTVGSPRTHRSLAAWLARDSGLPVVVIDYRLAPEHPFPAALDDALAAFDALASEGPVQVAGDSAGAGLALALALMLRERGGTQPTALALLAPLVDLRESTPLPPVAGEAMLTERWLHANARHYAGDDLANPRVSPLLADLRGLPPTLVQFGSDDLLRPQAEALLEALAQAGVETQRDLTPDRWHVFQLHAGQLPSADAAVARIAQFLTRARDAGEGRRHVHHTVILGAGMSGLCAAIELQKAGLHDFVMLEQSEGIGGTWWDNRYPGAQVDVPAPAYAFSFAPNPRWRQRFANASEIQAYQQALAERHGLTARLRLGTRLTEARYDEASGRWHFRTQSGESFESQFFICSTGPLSQPRWPDIPGLDDFRGERLHSARWDAEVAMQGKRVGVIGTGSTAVQLVPPVAAKAGQLYLFQRTANWVLPRLERKYRWFDRWLARVPPWAALVRRFWVAFLELGRRGFEEGTLMRRIMLWQGRRHLQAQVTDAGLRAALVPDYPLGCKRIIYSSDYYPTLCQPHVELVTAGIERFTATGIRCVDGSERELDVLVCATGFDTVNLLQSVVVAGRNGQTLAEAWRDGPEAWQGISVAGFPNLFLLLGPNTATGHTSTLLYIEPAVRYAIACMRAVAEGGHRAIEVREDVMRSHNVALQQRLSGSIWTQCSSWYRMDSGKVVAIFPGYTAEYRKGIRQLAPESFRFY